jgi:holin-like protein
LLFVPAGVGVMMYLPLVADEWLPIAGAVIIGTLATMAATAWVMNLFLKPSGGSGEQPEKREE